MQIQRIPLQHLPSFFCVHHFNFVIKRQRFSFVAASIHGGQPHAAICDEVDSTGNEASHDKGLTMMSLLDVNIWGNPGITKGGNLSRHLISPCISLHREVGGVLLTYICAWHDIHCRQEKLVALSVCFLCLWAGVRDQVMGFFQILLSCSGGLNALSPMGT